MCTFLFCIFWWVQRVQVGVGGRGQGSRWVPNEQKTLILFNWLVLYERLLEEKVKELKRWLVSCLLFTQWSEVQGSPETLTWASRRLPMIGKKKQEVQQDVLHQLQTISPSKTQQGEGDATNGYSMFHSPNQNEGCCKAAAVKSDIHREVFTEIETSKACNNRTSLKTVFHSGWAPQRCGTGSIRVRCGLQKFFFCFQNKALQLLIGCCQHVLMSIFKD